MFQKLKDYGKFLLSYIKPSADVLATDWLEYYGKKGKKKVLYLGLKYDYNNRSRGIGYPEYNFFNTLKNMDIELWRIDIHTIESLYGKELANNVIKSIALTENIDTIFHIPYLQLFNPELMRELTYTFKKETILWLSDDDKEYDKTIELCKYASKIVTTVDYRHEQRLKLGLNSLLSQYSANHFIYHDYELPKEYDVVFIGQNYGNRQEYVDYLIKNNIKVHAFGRGWKESGQISQADMITILNKAKIVLNFSSSFGHAHLKTIKGRVFEMAICGGMLLTETTENLEHYFDIGAEVDVFDNKEELLEKVKFYLNNDKTREEIAKRGKNKVLNNYTFEHEFKKILGV